MGTDPLLIVDCVGFLQWALPRLGRRWAGYRKVRRQVCRRVRGRIEELGVGGFDGYCAYLEERAEEWDVLDDERKCGTTNEARDDERSEGRRTK